MPEIVRRMPCLDSAHQLDDDAVSQVEFLGENDQMPVSHFVSWRSAPRLERMRRVNYDDISGIPSDFFRPVVCYHAVLGSICRQMS